MRSYSQTSTLDLHAEMLAQVHLTLAFKLIDCLANEIKKIEQILKTGEKKK